MRIFSRFVDYYDSIQSFDKDDICYSRKSGWFNLRDFIKNRYGLVGNHHSNASSEQLFKKMLPLGYRDMILGFCGKLYPIVEIYYLEKNEGKVSPTVMRAVFYNQAELEVFLNDMKFKIPRKLNYSNMLCLHETYFFRANEKIAQHKDKLLEIFNSLQVPIFLVRKDTDRINWEDKGYYLEEDIIETNPCLKDLSFQKIYDPFTCFQEISMYLGGVLSRPELSMLEISDDVKVQQHGFDKFSFRTMEGDKKPRKSNRGKL